MTEVTSESEQRAEGAALSGAISATFTASLLNAGAVTTSTQLNDLHEARKYGFSVSSVAAQLNMPRKDVVAELRSGKTISQIAADHATSVGQQLMATKGALVDTQAVTERSKAEHLGLLFDAAL